MAGKLDGKVALVTGAGSGLEKATAEHLGAEGARVAVTDINEQTAQATAQVINDAGGKAIAVGHDVTSEGDWRAAVKKTVDELGGLNILVNNAGISLHGDTETTDPAQFDKLLDTDLKSVYLGCHTAVAAMADSGGGSIINISSVAGIMGNPNTLGYGTAKAGVRYLTKSVALDCATKKYNIRCNSIHPTYIQTPLIDQFLHEDGALEKLGSMVPVGRICQTSDVTPAIVFLASDDSQMMTGSEVVIDGGLSCGYSPRVD